MLKLALRNLFEKKIRFVLTTLSVVMGVMFVVGTFVLTDSLRSAFGDLAQDIAGETDLTVRAFQDIGNEADRPTVPDSLLAEIAAVDGVAEAVGNVAALNVVIIDDEGKSIRPQGPPALGLSFSPQNLYVIDGREPAGPGEFVVDATTVERNDLVVGRIYDVHGPLSAEPFRLVGVFNFGSPESNTSLGQTMSVFELGTAQRFLGYEDEVAEIRIGVDAGADLEEVRSSIEALLASQPDQFPPDRFEVITREVTAQEQEDQFDSAVDIFSAILLVFAFIAVFVSAFIINNTFQIIVSQRVREIGLWRAIGVTPQQVSRSIVIESALVGFISTAIGIAGGMVLSVVMRAVIRAGGFSLPAGPLALRPRTLVLAIVIGFGVTMAASIVPAVRSRRIAPVAALAHDYRIDTGGLRRRMVLGSAVTGIGLVCLALGMFADLDTEPVLALTGVGALVTFVGINIASPVIARPVARGLGRPIQAVFGVPGKLARENAARSPRRTASTAGALMIGLALVSIAAVVGASVRKTVVETLSDAVQSDYFVQTEQAGFDPTAGFSAQVADDLDVLDVIDSTISLRVAFGGMNVDGVSRDIVTTDFDVVEEHLDGNVVSGGFAGSDPRTSVALHVDPAGDLGIAVGDTLEATFPDNETDTLTVVAIYTDAVIYGNWVIDNVVWDEHFVRRDVRFVSVTVAGMRELTAENFPELSTEALAQRRGDLLERSRVEVEKVMAAYPGLKAENRVEFRESQEQLLDSFLATITGLLGLALVIALVGITNTLALSVFERTREIGLLRAVGMTRRQLRRAVRWEAAIVATFGGLLGVVVGVVLGIAAALALPDSFVTDVDVPVGSLVIYVAVAGLAGLLAAVLPARRAGRMNILEAIAHE
ncbi:ABC transporter permease [Candidatus Poriferisodalis sp.]|uniref:ABC transporter permease n=1 Tax=Candidatus Poriferisodalis sp. TaxID=3101277 RepID=UPI003B528C77